MEREDIAVLTVVIVGILLVSIGMAIVYLPAGLVAGGALSLAAIRTYLAGLDEDA